MEAEVKSQTKTSSAPLREVHAAIHMGAECMKWSGEEVSEKKQEKIEWK